MLYKKPKSNVYNSSLCYRRNQKVMFITLLYGSRRNQKVMFITLLYVIEETKK